MTPRDYIHIATLGGAKALGMEDKVGSITPGKLADLMLLRNDRLLFPILDDLAERVMVYAGIQGIDSVRVQGKLEKKGGELVDSDKGLYKKAMKSWEIVRAVGETIKFTRNGRTLTAAEVGSPSLMPGRMPSPSMPLPDRQ